jgi:hypothetical protein
LASGKFRAAPDPLIVGKGLETIQAAVGIQKKGVSAKHIVVVLEYNAIVEYCFSALFNSL